MKYAHIALIGGYKRIRHLPVFQCPDHCSFGIGDLVEVPVGDHRDHGVVMSLFDEYDDQKAPKTLGNVIIPSYLSASFVTFLHLLSKKFFCHPSVFLQKMLLASEKKSMPRNPFPSLSGDSNASSSIIIGSHFSAKNVKVIDTMNQWFEKKSPVLFVVPTYFALKQAETLLSAVFPQKNIFCFHSYSTPSARLKLVTALAEKKVDLVIGMPSSIFLPWQELGGIVLNEYADDAYLELLFPFTDWSMLIRAFAEHFSVPIVCTSVMGDIADFLPEHQQKNTIVKYSPIAPIPRFLVDMNLEQQAENTSVFSRLAMKKIQEALRDSHQVLIHLNRKGVHWAMLCQDCGYAPLSPFSGLKMGVFKNAAGDFFLRCSTSNHTQAVSAVCPKCSGSWKMVGSGTQDIERIIAESFPAARVLRIDKDTMSSKGKIDDAIQRILENEVDIIIGTTFAVKGFAFRHCSTVIDLRSDMPLSFSAVGGTENARFRIAQLQDKIGVLENASLVLQTFFPTHPLFSSKEWASSALALRKQFLHPPYSQLVRIVASGKKKETVEKKLATQFATLRPLFFHVFPPRISFFEKTQLYEGVFQGFLKPEFWDALFESDAEVG